MPQIYFENLKSFCNAEIFFWHIKEGCNELSEYIADNGTLLSEAKRRFKSESRQREWLATRALLHSTQYKGETILYNDNGKPYLAGNNRHISISHTNEYVAIAVSDYPIGIDIERADRNAHAVAKHEVVNNLRELFGSKMLIDVGEGFENGALYFFERETFLCPVALRNDELFG